MFPVTSLNTIRGDEFVGIDIFSQPALFTRYSSGLLSSYCSDTYEDFDSTPMSYAKVEGLLKNLIDDEEMLNRRIQDEGTDLRNGSYRIHAAYPK